MIKINLCPIDELESQYWYVPDLATAVVVLVAGFFAVQYYLGLIQADIDDIQTKTASLEESTKKLGPDLARFKSLDGNIKELNSKLAALKTITVSKIAKYKPVIVLEHLQNLRSEGVWWENVKIGVESDDAFEVKGQAFDNILTAEFMTAIRSTGTQDLDQADLRTWVFFSELGLEDAKVPRVGSVEFPELGQYPEFVIKGKFQERKTAADAPSDKKDGDKPVDKPEPDLKDAAKTVSQRAVESGKL